MKNLGWIIAGVSAGILYYLYRSAPAGAYNTGYAGADDAADSVGNWGTKQRLGGAGAGVVGKVKEGFGKVTGDRQTQAEGVVDQVAGSVKDAAGQGAQAVGDAFRDMKQ